MELANTLRNAASDIRDLPGFGRAAQELIDRAQRLEEKQFTVALFGAFSAGKSSFANALIGDMVLPVSPNPTTAAINRILPPTDTFPHGSVRVKYKEEDALLKDVAHSVKEVGVLDDTAKASNDLVSDIAASAAKLTPDQVAPSAKAHLSFLKAVTKGYALHADRFGAEELVDLAAFKKIVAKEEHACFVEWIELYYDCELTRNRIVLVDTPGADSINARHTGVAFDYIKNADAILFITYYNHAFSRADQQFLAQLGRVKGSFELDKLFFVINASDLADSPDELETVIAHLNTQLGKVSISSTRIYPVSSQIGLMSCMHARNQLTPQIEKVYRSRLGVSEDQLLPSAEEARQISGFNRFEEEFYRFLKEDLTHLAELAAKTELQAVRDRLQQLIQVAESNEEEKRKLSEQLNETENKVIALAENWNPSSEQSVLKNEIATLLYYVKQRLIFNFSDLVNEAFHPGLFREGQDVKQALHLASREFTAVVRSLLDDEYRAASLRVEREAQNSLKRISNSMWERIQNLAEITPQSYQHKGVPVPDSYIETSPLESIEWKSVFHYFKNARDFFEGNGKAAFRDALEKLVAEALDQELQTVTVKVTVYYERFLADGFESLKRFIIASVREHFQTVRSLTDNRSALPQFKAAFEKIRQLELT